ncbi:MAG: DUF4330 domain-containing protein [Nanobdellota archaeon]
MKIIDSRGRLFGKFNLIDMMAVLFVLLVLAVGVKFVYLQEDKYIPVEVDLVAKDQLSIDTLHPGKKIIKNNQTIGIIEDINVIPASSDYGSEKNVYMTVKMKVKKGEKENLLFDNQLIKLNNEISLEFSDISMKTVVTGINVSKETLEKEIELDLGNTKQSKLQMLKNEKVLKNYQGEKIGEILELKAHPTGGNNFRVNLYAKLKCEKRKDTLYFQKQPVMLDNNLNIAFSSFKINGKITSLEQEEKDSTKKVIEVINYNMKPWQADMISTGDTQKDFKNKVTAEVVEKVMEPAEMVVVSDSGEVYKRENPVNKDVTLTLEVTATKSQEGLFFSGKELKVSKNFYFETNDYDFSGSIISIK